MLMRFAKFCWFVFQRLQSWLPWAGALLCLGLIVRERFVFPEIKYQESVPAGARAGVCRQGCCSPASLQLWAWVSSCFHFEMSLKFRSLSCCVIFKPSQVIQIMVALFYLGLGPRQIFNFPVDSTDMGATFWLGVVVNYTSQYLFYETHLSLWHHYFFTLYLMLLIVMWFHAFLSLQYLTAGVLVVVAGLSLSVWLVSEDWRSLWLYAHAGMWLE